MKKASITVTIVQHGQFMLRFDPPKFVHAPGHAFDRDGRGGYDLETSTFGHVSSMLNEMGIAATEGDRLRITV